MDDARAERKARLAEHDALLAGIDGYVLNSLAITPPSEDKQRVFTVRVGQLSPQGRIDSDYYHPERIRALRSLETAPAGLRVVSLGDMVSFIREQLPTPTETYLSLAHVESHTGELTNVKDTATGTCFAYRRGDVLFARLRPYLNKVHQAETGGSCSTEFRVLRINNTNELLPDYLATIMRSRVILAQTIHMMTGNTHPRLTDDDMERLKVPVPGMEIQQKIADEVNRRRAESRRLIAEAETDWKAAKEWFEEQVLGTVR